MKIKVFSTGGTIDKIYFDAKNDYQVGAPQIIEVLKDAHVTFEFDVESILKKDSLDMTDTDRELILSHVSNDPANHIIITHGTDTMVLTAKVLKQVSGKVIVLTGSMEPARFKGSDAVFNIGCAVGAVQALQPGVYIALNGRIFNPEKVKKNVLLNQFEEI